jgi:hypothetical protein
MLTLVPEMNCPMRERLIQMIQTLLLVVGRGRQYDKAGIVRRPECLFSILTLA